jgi:hypothetical protein
MALDAERVSVNGNLLLSGGFHAEGQVRLKAKEDAAIATCMKPSDACNN